MEASSISHNKAYIIGLTAVIAILVIGIGWFSKRAALNQEPQPIRKTVRLKVPAAPIPVAGPMAVSESQGLETVAVSSSPPDLEQQTPPSAGEPGVSGQPGHTAKPGTDAGEDNGPSFASETAAAQTTMETSPPGPVATQDPDPGEKSPFGSSQPGEQLLRTELRPDSQMVSDRQNTPYYAIQVGAFKSRINAQRLMEQLQHDGHDAFIAQTDGGAAGTLHAVRFGRFATQSLARDSLSELHLKENIAAIIIRVADGQLSEKIPNSSKTQDQQNDEDN